MVISDGHHKLHFVKTLSDDVGKKLEGEAAVYAINVLTWWKYYLAGSINQTEKDRRHSHDK